MPPPYPLWNRGVTPHIHRGATAHVWRFVQNANVIQVTGSTYRNCTPIDDVFELADPAAQPSHMYGALRIEVLCSWFGVKPITVHPNLIVIPGQFQVIANYHGNVVDDISA